MKIKVFTENTKIKRTCSSGLEFEFKNKSPFLTRKWETTLQRVKRENWNWKIYLRDE